MERMYNNVPSITIQNGSDVISHFYNYASYLGWEVIDSNIVDASGDYVVLKSEGGSKNNGRMPCYLKIYTNYTTYVNWNYYVHWDPSDHSWAGAICYTTPTSFHSYILGVAIEANNDNEFHFRGNKDFIMMSNYKVSANVTYRSVVLRIDNPFWDIIAHIQDSGTSGSTTVTLLDGEVDQFEIGGTYRMISLDGHIDTASVFSKDSQNNQMVLTGHTYPTASGAYIGTYPFPWIGMGNPVNNASYSPTGLLHNTTSQYSTAYAYSPSYSLGIDHGMIVNLSYHEDYFNHGIVSLWPYVFYEGTYGVWGHSSYLCYFKHGSEWDKFAVNVQDTGVVDNATATTIVGVDKNWTEDVLAGLTLVITSGDAEEECRYITSNTSNQITFDPAINPTVSGAETFSVCDGVYMRYPPFSSRSYFGIKEV